MPKRRRPIVAVVGAREASSEVLAAAEDLGMHLMEGGFRLLSGGRGGVMEAVSRGARQSDAWVEGRILAIVPSDDPDEANPYVDVVIPSGMGVMRNALIVRTADAVVAVGGGAGTLSEMALAWQMDKPIASLDRGEGWGHRLAGVQLDDRRPGRVEGFTEVSALMDWLENEANATSP